MWLGALEGNRQTPPKTYALPMDSIVPVLVLGLGLETAAKSHRRRGQGRGPGRQTDSMGKAQDIRRVAERSRTASVAAVRGRALLLVARQRSRDRCNGL